MIVTALALSMVKVTNNILYLLLIHTHTLLLLFVIHSVSLLISLCSIAHRKKTQVGGFMHYLKLHTRGSYFHTMASVLESLPWDCV